jgi:hypothetical protein
MDRTPYLEYVDLPRMMMSSKGSLEPTIYGQLGKGRQEDPYRKTLGGLVVRTTPGHLDAPVVKASKEHVNTDRHILGPAAKTKVPGSHHGMVPFAGQFRSHEGSIV